MDPLARIQAIVSTEDNDESDARTATITDLLVEVPFLTPLSAEQRLALAEEVQIGTYSAGTNIITEGEEIPLLARIFSVADTTTPSHNVAPIGAPGVPK